MTHATLEERVAVLEQTVARLVAGGNGIKKDWQSTIGMFEGDAVIREIQEEGRKLREVERQATREEADL
jgi:hypothetical protein